MFAVTEKSENLSPIAMRFGRFWIYDLRAFHDFWMQMVRHQKTTFVDASPWSALLKAYRLHLFSPLKELVYFARDFHTHYPDLKAQMSEKKIRDVFEIFSNLG